MLTTRTLLPITFIICCSVLKAQNQQSQQIHSASTTQLLDMMQDHTANIHDVQNAFNAWYNTQPQRTKEEKEESERKGNEEEENEGYNLFKRWEWLMVPRTYPSGIRPDIKSLSDEYQNFRHTHASESHATHSIESAANWSYIGNTSAPANTNDGRVNRIRIDPTNSNTLYACAASGGLWKSTNGGTSWSTNTDELLSLGVSDVAIDPTNTNIMYLATGDGDGVASYYGAPTTMGVLKSTDGGLTWNATSLYYTLQASGPSEITVNQLLINPTNTSILFAAASGGLYYTSNGGITWYEVQTGNMKSVEFAPGNPSIVYASSGSGKFYRSTNGGVSFSSITLPSSAGAGRLQIAVTPANANYVYVVGGNSSTYAFLGLWLSTDQGATFTLKSSSPNILGWSNTGSDLGEGQEWYDLAIAADPTNANNVMVGGVNIWRSTNEGANWTLNADWEGTGAAYVHSDIHHILFAAGSGSTIYCGTDGAVFKTTNTGPNWNDISNNLEISQSYSLGLSASNANIWINGWQDNGTILDNGGTFGAAIGGDGMTCFIDFSSNTYMYGTTDGDFQRSSNGGNTFRDIGISTTESENWVPPFIQDQINSQTLYAGFQNVWKTTNRGTNWSAISTFGTSGDALIALAVAPSNSNYLYAAYYTSIYMTANGGTSWTNVTSGLPTGSASITDVVVDPANPLRAWVTFSGYSAADKVFQTINGGTSWTNISTDLPNLPVNTLVYQKGGVADAMYIGTDVGVYFRDTTDTHGAWVNFSKGMPDVIVTDLRIYYPSSYLRAATYGRGVWQTGLYTSPTVAPSAAFRGYPTTVCANSSVQFFDTSSNSPTSWNWTFTGGNPATSTLQNPTVSYAAANTYPVKLVVSNLTGSDSVTKNSYVTINSLPGTLAVSQSANNDTLTCSPSNLPYYQWFKNNVMIPGATSFNYYPVTAIGIYKVYGSDSAGCSSNASHTVTVVGIDELSLNQYFKVYPNPSNGIAQLSLDLPESGEYNLKITDVLGQVVYTNKLMIDGAYTTDLNLSGYGKGLYIISLTGKNSSGVEKIIVY